jgi:hypothetical protein
MSSINHYFFFLTPDGEVRASISPQRPQGEVKLCDLEIDLYQLADVVNGLQGAYDTAVYQIAERMGRPPEGEPN